MHCPCICYLKQCKVGLEIASSDNGGGVNMKAKSRWDHSRIETKRKATQWGSDWDKVAR
jgi:hypothetical protein